MTKWIMVLGLGILPGLFLLTVSPHPVIFESLESRTNQDKPVFNRIRFLPGWQRDVWLMQQSHAGINSEFLGWDRLAIVVDKSVRPFTANFYQVATGELKFEAPPIPFKARCFACHANGPRAVRWNSASIEALPTLWGRMQVAMWNLRIKAYGHVTSKAGAEFSVGTAFRSKYPVFSRSLGLKTCEKCHSAGGLRNELRLEHVATASFLVRNGFMPPFPFRATQAERDALEKYLSTSASSAP